MRHYIAICVSTLLLSSCGGSSSDISAPISAAPPPVLVNPAPTVNAASSFAFGNGIYVTPSGNSLSTSSDGVTWSAPNPALTSRFSKVIYADKQFIAVGEKGLSATSTDGLNWSLRNTGTDRDLIGLEAGNGIYLALGSPNPLILLSQSPPSFALAGTDGKSWTVRELFLREPLRRAIFVNGKFTAVQPDGLYTSANGLDWTASTVPITVDQPNGTAAGILRTFAYGNGRYVVTVEYRTALGANTGYALFTSDDGKAWQRTFIGTPLTSQGRINDLIYAGGQFVVVGSNGLLLTSKDGVSWDKRNAGTSSWYAVSYGSNSWFIGGELGSLATSTDGVMWTKRQTDVTRGIYAFRFTTAAVYALLGRETTESATYDAGYGINGQRGTLNLMSVDGITWSFGPSATGEQFDPVRVDSAFY